MIEDNPRTRLHNAKSFQAQALMVLGGLFLFVFMAIFVVVIEAEGSTLLGILSIPLYFLGEGVFDLMLNRWPNLSAENSGFSFVRILKGTAIGTLLFFAALALFFTFI